MVDDINLKEINDKLEDDRKSAQTVVKEEKKKVEAPKTVAR